LLSEEGLTQRGTDTQCLFFNSLFFTKLIVWQVFSGNGVAPDYAIKLLDWSARLGNCLEEALGHCREIAGGSEVHGSQS
jgi:hypothetical protein